MGHWRNVSPSRYEHRNLLPGNTPERNGGKPENSPESETMTDNTPIAVIQRNRLEELRVELSEFKGHRFVSVRTYTERHDSPELVPTKKGSPSARTSCASLSRRWSGLSTPVGRRGYSSASQRETRLNGPIAIGERPRADDLDAAWADHAIESSASTIASRMRRQGWGTRQTAATSTRTSGAVRRIVEPQALRRRRETSTPTRPMPKIVPVNGSGTVVLTRPNARLSIPSS